MLHIKIQPSSQCRTASSRWDAESYTFTCVVMPKGDEPHRETLLRDDIDQRLGLLKRLSSMSLSKS